MTPLGNQRWRLGRDAYRPAGEVLRPSEYDVAPVAEDRVARAFVEAHHYSGSYPAARERVGLYRHGALVGVAVFSHPSNDRVLTNTFPTVSTARSVELGRFVLLDEVPGNGETWFLARCFAHLRREDIAGVVSFSDPVQRTTAAGRVVFPGHVGTIYQAANARYLGRGTPRTLRILADGRVFSARTEQKIRGAERGWRAAVAQLVAAGAGDLALDADPAARRAWVTAWTARLTRALRHPGNHRYAWALDARAAIGGTAAPFPKRSAA